MVTLMQRSRCLFEPLNLGGIILANRIAVSPMCQYSAEDGAANDWHLQHLGSLSLSGAALVFVEQTAVEPAGRISHGWLGLYSDANERALARVVGFCRRAGSAALGIQLGQAGRKGSAKLPWEGGGPLEDFVALARGFLDGTHLLPINRAETAKSDLLLQKLVGQRLHEAEPPFLSLVLAILQVGGTKGLPLGVLS